MWVKVGGTQRSRDRFASGRTEAECARARAVCARSPCERRYERLTADRGGDRSSDRGAAQWCGWCARPTSGLATLPDSTGDADSLGRPDLSRAGANRRAMDIDIVQNGVWLTTVLGVNRDAIRRSVLRCEEITLQ